MLGISMRRMRWTYPNGNKEIRDGLDIGWWRFLNLCLPGYSIFPLPNIGEQIWETLVSCKFSGFILTGGDDWGVFPERDATETAISRFAEERALPLLGICRGAQVINSFYNGVNSSVKNHAGTRHNIYFNNLEKRRVNSFHNYGIKTTGTGLTAIAKDDDGFVEAFSDSGGRITGVMWHPERESIPDPADMELIKKLFNKAKK